MPPNSLTRQQRAHRLGHTVANALTVVFDDWPDLRTVPAVRSLCREAGWALEHLTNGDPSSAEACKAIVNEWVAQLPNGDTTKDAT